MNGREEDAKKIENMIKQKLMEMPSFISDWDLDLAISDKLPTTRLDYIRKISRFINFAQIKQPKDITRSIIRSYFNHVKINQRTGEKTTGDFNTANWSAMKSLLLYLQEGGLISDIVQVGMNGHVQVAGVEKPKPTKLSKINEKRILLTKEDFNRILDAVDHTENYVQNARDKAILTLFMTTGMRETALAEINVEDIEDGMIKYIDKREKYFSRQMSEIVQLRIQEWLSVRDEYANRNNNNSSALFLSNRGQRICTDAIQDIVKKYSEKALGYKISPHKLRSGFISILYKETGNLEFVRRAVGHEFIQTTQRYTVTEGKEGNQAGTIISNMII